MGKLLTLDRLLAIDPSLTCSGWALFRVSNGELVGVGKIKSLPASLPLAVRLRNLQEKVEQLYAQLSLKNKDLLVCEAPTTMRDPRAAIKVEQVRGIFETMARTRELVVPGRINPRSVHSEVIGLRGRQQRREIVKLAAAQLVLSLFGESLERMGFEPALANLRRNQDIVDAILIGHVSLARVRSAQHTGIPLEQLFEISTTHSRRKARRAA
jgi:Holliday junction resolvasome RuvABC endonuclease subunit